MPKPTDTPKPTNKDKPVLDSISKVDPDFMEMVTRMRDVTWAIEELSPREKCLLCILADVCYGNFGAALEMHMKMALSNDVPLAAVKEVILHAALHAGYGNTLEALGRFKEIAESLEKSQGDRSLEKDKKQRKKPGNGKREEEIKLPRPQTVPEPPFREAWNAGVLQQWYRPELAPKERGMLAVAAAVCNQTLGEPFEYFVYEALRFGASGEQLRGVICFLCEFGLAKAWKGLEALQAIPRRAPQRATG
jgi:alkylhydroperoxidase/carboxymuconolactone decarboxylase family protein YurZ